MAPVDIIISIVDRMKRSYESELEGFKGDNLTLSNYEGKIEAMNELKEQLEGFKKLFN